MSVAFLLLKKCLTSFLALHFLHLPSSSTSLMTFYNFFLSNLDFTGSTWDHSANKCYCRASQTPQNFVLGSVISLVATSCASLTAQLPTGILCQSVSFVTGACVSSDSTPCWTNINCKDTFATACDSTGGVSKSW